MEGRRALCLMTALASAIVVVSFNGRAAEGGQPAGSGADTTVLCVSKCGTCPTVCSSSPPPPAASYVSGSAPSTTPSSSSPASHSTSPPGQSKGGHPSSYYYFFTAGSGRAAGPSGYALVLILMFVSLAAGFQ